MEALPQLQVLRGASNALTGPLPPLPPGLVALDLSNNALQGESWAAF